MLSGCRPAPQHFEIASSSMAPTLLGPTFQAQCPNCQWQFRVAADTYKPTLPTRCLQCGDQCDVGQTLFPGDRVTLETIAAPATWPRFKLVACQARHAGSPWVKRIWGLPGERLTMSGGELYLSTLQSPEPRLLQKTMAELESVSVQVSNFPTDRFSHWYISRNGPDASHACLPLESALQSPTGPKRLSLPTGSVLRWFYRRPAAVHPRQTPVNQWLTPSRLLDDYTINQGVSCSLHEVNDYLLTVLLREPLTGVLTIEMRCNGTTLTVVCSDLKPEPSDSLGSASPSIHTAPAIGRGLPVRAARRIQIAWCDQRLLIETDLQQAVFAAEQLAAYYTHQPTPQPPEHPVLLKITGSTELPLEQLIVARDLYFEDWDDPVGPYSGYFLLGDNLPVSIDSRRGLGRISADQILGRVLPDKTPP